MTAPKRVLCSIYHIARRQTPYVEKLRAAGFEVDTNELGRAYTEDELVALLPGYVATIAGSEPYTARVFEAAPDFRVIARYGVGYDAIDVDAATRTGVAVAMAFGTNHDAVADLAFSLMAACAAQILLYDRKVRAGGWGPNFHSGLWQKTVGIIGLGRIGQAMARRCAGFEMRILAHDPVVPEAVAAAAGATLVGLDELLAEADFVSIHAPLGDGTRHLIDGPRLARMKPTAYVINTARGGLIDEEALCTALESGVIAGAGLDVFAREPAAGSRVLGLDNVVCTPHIAGLNTDSDILMGNRCAENIIAILEGRDPGEGLLLNPEILVHPA